MEPACHLQIVGTKKVNRHMGSLLARSADHQIKLYLHVGHRPRRYSRVNVKRTGESRN